MNHPRQTADKSTQTDLTGDKPHHYQTFVYTSQNPKRRNYNRKVKKKNKKEHQNQEPETQGTQPTVTQELFSATTDAEVEDEVAAGVANMNISKTNLTSAPIAFLCPDHVMATTASAAAFCARLDADRNTESAGAVNGIGSVETDLKQAEAYFAGMRKVLDERTRLCNELERRVGDLNTICKEIRSTDRKGMGEEMQRLGSKREWLVVQIRVLRARWNVCGDWI